MHVTCMFSVYCLIMNVPVTVFCEVTWQGQAVTARRAVAACRYIR